MKNASNPQAIHQVINSAWHSLNDVCAAWNIPDEMRAQIRANLINRGKGFEFGGDYFAFGESIMRAFRDATKTEDSSSQGGQES
jgi:hypothetical protein